MRNYQIVYDSKHNADHEISYIISRGIYDNYLHNCGHRAGDNGISGNNISVLMRGNKRLLISKKVRADRIEHRDAVIQIHMLNLVIEIYKRIKERNECNARNGHRPRYY